MERVEREKGRDERERERAREKEKGRSFTTPGELRRLIVHVARIFSSRLRGQVSCMSSHTCIHACHGMDDLFRPMG